MKRCSDVDKLVTPFVDGETTPADRESVNAHLGVCPPCRRHERAERTARDTMRAHADGLITAAPPVLRRQCLTTAAKSHSRWVSGAPARTGWPLAMAATLLLSIAGAAVYSTFINPTVAVAAQLTLDHLKCFALFDRPEALDPAQVRVALRDSYGWDIVIPARGELGGLDLVGGRRCVYLDGAIAHLLYKQGSVPVSVFILPSGVRLPGQDLDIMGYAAVAFERGGRTWVVLTRGASADAERYARRFMVEPR